MASDAADSDPDLDLDDDEVEEEEDDLPVSDEEEDDDADGEEPPGAPEKEPDPPPAPGARGIRRIILVPPEEWRTSDRLSTPEAARAIGIRAAQIAKNNNCFLTEEQKEGLTTASELAQRELFLRCSPLKVRRRVGTLPNGDILVEERSVNDMTFPPFDTPRG